MLHKDEIKILRILKLTPFLIVLFCIIPIVIIVYENHIYFEEEAQKINEEALFEKKELIKREVQRVYDFIYNEKKQTIQKIKENIKNRVYEAHSIATSIYENNKHRNEDEIKKLIADALRDIRFSKGRGYFFVYQSNGTNVMHPILKHIEGKNIWNFQDVKGSYVIQNLSNIAKNKGEGYYQWWWTKPTDIQNEYEKIGFSKYFEPFDWFIGTGDYVLDYEEELKKELLNKIDKIRYGKNGYIFIVNNRGVYLSHIEKSYIGKNRINVVDENGFEITKEIIKASLDGEKYLSYIGTIKPTTGKPAKKISYIKGFKDWNWAIGSGVYVSELEDTIAQKIKLLDEDVKNKIIQIILISSFVLLLLFIVALVFANNIKYRFQSYKRRVEDKTIKLNDLNENLENEVVKRTKELQNSIKNLKKTQKKLVESEKMASLGGLVAGVAHEINTPLGVGLTGISHLIDINQKIKSEYESQAITEEDFQNYLNTSEELMNTINKNLNRMANLIKNFKQIAVNEEIEDDEIVFNLEDFFKEFLLNNENTIKNEKIDINFKCDGDINLYSRPVLFTLIFNNLITNSIKHGFYKHNNNKIDIFAKKVNKELVIEYMDNGKGIPVEITNKIFEPFFTTNRDDGGTGLGLNVIYNTICNRLGGTIECKNCEDKGVCFKITIPLK